MTAPLVRPYRPGDLEAVRTICCDTAFYGEPIERVLTDRPLIAESLLSYYAEIEPESFFIAEQESKVIGYLTGCLDTARFERIYARRILPRLLRQFVTHGHWHRRISWQMFISMFRAGRQQFRDRQRVITAYPAHCHVNLEAGARRTGTGTTLIETFFRHAREHRVMGVHVSTATDQGKAFFAKAGFTMLARYPLPKLHVPSPTELWVMGRLLT